ncbi:hypothetical protein ACB092_12G211700 [Castanea dentata]
MATSTPQGIPILPGARWRVCNGESIGVWLDAWLPYNDLPRILSPIVDGFKEAKVATSLIRVQNSGIQVCYRACLIHKRLI